ncbi:MAG: chromosome segregation protein SMC [Trueperaceae bacterium]|nr:chromosome segregation protein SMC [Trueperaceae bacterium]
MRLASLTLQGFKSFGNRATLEFAPGVTAIIGPNGSGKSNVLDALRWTTGGGRAREFRATDKTDLIFHGASGKRSVGLAEVELELKHGGAGVKVYRSIDRDGTTRLRLNGRSARFLDVEEALAGTGLGRSGLAIIGQGEVSQVLMADPAKLLEHVAEAAGVARLAGRRDQTVARLETAGQHLARLQDVLAELAARCRSLEGEAAGAKRHAELSALQLRLRFTLARLREAGLATEIAELDGRRGLLEAALADGRQRLLDLREGGRRLATDRDGAEERYREAAARLEYRRGNLRLAQERLERLTERADALAARARAVSTERDRLAQAARPTPPDEAPQAAAERAAAAALGAADREAALTAAADRERAAREAFERLRRDHATVEREGAALESRREALRAQLTQVDAQVAAMEADTSGADLEALGARQAAAAADLARAEGEAEAQRAALQRAHERHALAAAEAVSRGAAAARSRAAFEARRGFAQGPRNALASGIEGVIGAVADLVKVAPEYQEAIAGALGRRAEYVVVATAEAGKKVLEHVRRSGGFVTVLPLDLLRPQGERGRPGASHPGVIAPATALIEVDGEYATLFDNLLSGTLVVTDIDAATAIARRPGARPRLVTLQGDVVEPSGAMSGGKRSQHATVLGAAADLEEAEAAARSSSDAAQEAQRQLNAEQAVMRELLEAVRTAAEANRGAALALAEARERGAGRERLLIDLRSRRERLAAESAALPEVPHAAATDLVAAVATAEADLDGAVAALDAARTALAEARGEAARAEQAAALARERWRQHEEALSRYEAGAARAVQLAAEHEELARAAAEQAVELAAAETERDAAQAAVPADLATEEGEVAAARAALAAFEEQLTAETAAQATRAQELEDVRLQAARRDAALELAQEELRAFPAGIEALDITERAGRARLREVTDELDALGAVNHRAAIDLAEVTERKENLEVEAVQATLAVAELESTLDRIDKETSARLNAALERLQTAFSRHVKQLFGPDARGAIEVDAEGSRPVGVRIRLQPPGKQTHSLHLLSVGERTMGALAFLFSLIADEGGGLPVAVLDEVDAPLDEANIRRYGQFVARLAAQGTQFVLITHQKATFEIAETLWGITTEQGVSRVFSIRKEAELPA